MTVTEIVKMLEELPPNYEVAIETTHGISEVYDFEMSKERVHKLAVDYSGDYHELQELDNHEVPLANKIPGLIILKPILEL
jgi:DNA-binding ferritin-like protein (Dps family)